VKLYIKIDGQPAVIVGYGPGKNGPQAIVIGLAPHPVAVSLDKCLLPKIPRKLERKIKSWAKRETINAQVELVIN